MQPRPPGHAPEIGRRGEGRGERVRVEVPDFIAALGRCGFERGDTIRLGQAEACQGVCCAVWARYGAGDPGRGDAPAPIDQPAGFFRVGGPGDPPKLRSHIRRKDHPAISPRRSASR